MAILPYGTVIPTVGGVRENAPLQGVPVQPIQIPYQQVNQISIPQPPAFGFTAGIWGPKLLPIDTVIPHPIPPLPVPIPPLQQNLGLGPVFLAPPQRVNPVFEPVFLHMPPIPLPRIKGFAQERANPPTLPSPRGTFTWSPAGQDYRWTNWQNWQVGVAQVGVPGTLANPDHLYPRSSDAVVFDGSIAGGAFGADYPEASGPICGSMVFKNTFVGLLSLGQVQLVTGDITISNLTIADSSNPRIGVAGNNLVLAGVCDLGNGVTLNVDNTKRFGALFSSSLGLSGLPAGLRLAIGSTVTLRQASVTSNSGIAVQGTLNLPGSTINCTAVAVGTAVANFPVSTFIGGSINVTADTTVAGDGYLNPQGGTVTIGTPSGAGDDGLPKNLTIHGRQPGSACYFYQTGGDTLLYNGSTLNGSGVVFFQGGTVQALYSTQGIALGHVGAAVVSIDESINPRASGSPAPNFLFLAGTITLLKNGASTYASLSLTSTALASAVYLSGKTALAIAVNGQTPGTGCKLTSTNPVFVSGDPSVQVTDGSGSGIVAGSWTLLSGLSAMGNFRTVTVPDGTMQTVYQSGSAFLFSSTGSANIQTACCVNTIPSTLKMAVSGGLSGSFVITWDGVSKWTGNIQSLIISVYCDGVNWQLSPTSPGGVAQQASAAVCGPPVNLSWAPVTLNIPGTGLVVVSVVVTPP